jgi:type VI secretion system protein VasI
LNRELSAKWQHLVGLCLLGLASSAAAIDVSNLARCAALESPRERLMCYDKLAAEFGIDGPASEESPVGAWQIQTEISPIDNSVNVYLYVIADEPLVSSSGEHVWPAVGLRCKENTTAVLIAWGVYAGEFEQKVFYRIDSQPAHREWWKVSVDHDMVGLWTGATAIPFIKQLFGAKQLLVRMTPRSATSLMGRLRGRFRVEGLEQVIEPLRRQCHW